MLSKLLKAARWGLFLEAKFSNICFLVSAAYRNRFFQEAVLVRRTDTIFPGDPQLLIEHMLFFRKNSFLSKSHKKSRKSHKKVIKSHGKVKKSHVKSQSQKISYTFF